MKIAVIGCYGNMGRRYSAILRFLGHEVIGVDIDNKNQQILPYADGFVIATPTHRHIEDVQIYAKYEKPMLVEKPFSKDIMAIEDIFTEISTPIDMINQYEFFIRYLSSGGDRNTRYDFYKTGSDGLHWDCMNIIGLSDDLARCHINNKSPVWQCKINGIKCHYGLMDHAYIWNIVSWLTDPANARGYILNSHQRVLGFG